MAYRDRWLKYFDHFDINKNNFLDPEDFKIVGEAVDRLFGIPADGSVSTGAIFHDYFVAFIRELDIDKDGKLTREEVLQGAEKYFVGKDASTAPKWWVDLIQKFFQVFDKDHNGSLSLQEVKDYVKKVYPGEDDAKIEHAFEWAKKQSPSGKWDADAVQNTVLTWAGSRDPTPEADVLLPFFYDH